MSYTNGKYLPYDEETLAIVGLFSSISCMNKFEEVYKNFAEYNISVGRKPPVFVVDYLQLLRVKGMNETEGLTVIMPRLKDLALHYKTIGIVIIANNRESDKNEPSMSSGRGSSSIEFGLDLMLSVTREKPVNGVSKVTFTPTKGRWTDDSKALHLDFRGEYMHFTVNDDSLYGEPLTTREAKIVKDIMNQPDEQSKLAGL
jgi:replicative DNA helicase